MITAVSFEIAKKLKEAGWPQDLGSIYYDLNNRGELSYIRTPQDKDEWLCAPTLGELFRQLPHESELWKYKKYPKSPGIWSGEYSAVYDGAEFGAQTPEDAAALLWIEIKESELVESA